MAICGGVSSILSPESFIPLCKARMMSTIGQCQTFCDSADGYARGEGCGVLLLKKLSKVYVLIFKTILTINVVLSGTMIHDPDFNIVFCFLAYLQSEGGGASLYFVRRPLGQN